MGRETVKTVIVLGMHRSGTSMTAGVLSCLGVNMGRKRLERSRLPGNPLGHYEDRGFVNLNTCILTRAGGSWQNPPEREAILKEQKRFALPIKELLAGLDSFPAGWKDPRTSLTIELYLAELKNPFFLVCHRQPGEVAYSLYRRNKLPLKEGLVLQHIYEDRIEKFFSLHPRLPRLDLNYEEVTRDPVRWIRAICKFLGIKPDSRQLREAEEFVLPNEVTHQLASRLAVRLRLQSGQRRPFPP